MDFNLLILNLLTWFPYCKLIRTHPLLSCEINWITHESNLFHYYILSLQVGGHTRLLLLNQSTVIKPLNIRELDFYQNIPSDIQMFVPKYKGKFICLFVSNVKMFLRAELYCYSRDEHSKYELGRALGRHLLDFTLDKVSCGKFSFVLSNEWYHCLCLRCY